LGTTNPGLNLIIGNTANPRLVISALQAVTQTKILSNPSLVVVDGKPATFQVGDELPVQTGSTTSTIGGAVTNSYSYLDTGIILSVVPRVNANGVVSLEVDQQISSCSANCTPTTTSSANPTIQQRRVKSYVSVTDGQTVLLAGLITDNRNTSRSGIPGLDQLVFLRDLLSTTSSTVGRQELIIFIRPQIIKNSFDAQQVSEEFRERLQSMQARRGVYKPGN
jgi:general secretion pathway protein D